MNVPVEKIESKKVEQVAVHPLKKSHMFVSNRHIDYDKLTAFEAVSMTAVFVLAVTVGALTQTPIA